MERQQQMTAALNAAAAEEIERIRAVDPRPWWQRDDAPADGFLIADLTDEEIDDAPGWGDLGGDDR